MIRLAAVLAALGCCAAAGAAEPPPPAKVRECSVCHGAMGLSTAPDAPNLAGQPRIYLAAQMKQFRSGKRASEVMNVIAKPLSDAEIEALADWYASIRISAAPAR